MDNTGEAPAIAPKWPDYVTVIERGHTTLNDQIHDFIKKKIVGHYLDIGCNTGWMLEEVPNGIGIDASPVLIAKAREKVLNARMGRAECLQFDEKEFQTVLLVSVLEQVVNPGLCLEQAQRVGQRVIGINPVPGASEWGKVGGWVRSLIPEEWMFRRGYVTERLPFAPAFYYFEWHQKII